MQAQIIFEDTHLLVINKPAGLLSQGEITGDDNLVDELRIYLGRPYVGLVHRLDRNTSGLLVVAKRTKSAQRLTDALQAGTLTREYLALIHGELKAPARWLHYLLKDGDKNITRVVGAQTPKAQKAELTVTPLESGRWRNQVLTLARFKLETGRSHQIRAQAAHEKFALLGDAKYGSPSGKSFDRPALHSVQISFPHPKTQEILQFASDLPADMRSVLDEMRRDR